MLGKKNTEKGSLCMLLTIWHTCISVTSMSTTFSFHREFIRVSLFNFICDSTSFPGPLPSILNCRRTSSCSCSNWKAPVFILGCQQRREMDYQEMMAIWNDLGVLAYLLLQWPAISKSGPCFEPIRPEKASLDTWLSSQALVPPALSMCNQWCSEYQLQKLQFHIKQVY